jgi:MYXO-CTERM domain-containing protein
MNRHALFAIVGMTSLLLAGRASAGAEPLFDLQADALDPQACGGQGCWTNHLRVTDFDGDGDLDILLANYADFFSGNDDPEPLVLYTNDGTGAFTNASSAALGNYSGNLHQVAVGDVDGDGSRDIFGPSGSGDAYVLFINDGMGVFTDEADTRLPKGPYPQGAAARMGDVDGDGDLDIFAADGYATDAPPFGHIYINDGAGMFEEAAGAIPDSIMGSDIDDVEFLDADNDHDLDLVVNAHAGGTGAIWINDGTGSFVAQTTISPPGAGSNFHYNVAPCDVDGDGDLDLWIDNTGGNYTEQLLINDGVGNFTDETEARVTGNPSNDDNGVVCADIDNDGDLDGVVIALGSPERYLENDGSGAFTYVAGVFPGPTNCSLWGEFGDLNGDGRIDLVTGQGECSSSDEVYFANDGVPVDSVAPVLRTVETVADSVEPDTEVVVRFAVSDRTVTDDGPHLERAYAVIDPKGAATEVPAIAIGGDLFRAVLPGQADGVVVFQVCAEDPAGNVGCSESQMYDVGMGGTESESGTDPTDPDTSASSDPTDADSSGSASASATMTDPSATASDTATATDTASGSEDSSGSDTAGGDDSGGGCSCDAGQNRAPAWFGIAALGLVLARRRHRR